MAIATSTAILAAGIFGAGASIASSVLSARSKPKLFDSLQTPPAAPDPAKVIEDTRKKTLRAASARTKSILTSPVGLTTEPTTRKTLLGGG